MKKAILVITSTLMVLNFTACSSKEEVVKANKLEGECLIQGVEAPAWVCGAYEEQARYTAVGSAPFSKLGQNFSRSEALLNARTNLVNQIKLDVKSKAESYMRSTGLKDNEVVEKVVTLVTKQTTNLTLKDSKQISYWQSPSDKEIYILVAMDKSNINKSIDSSVKEAVDAQIQIRNSEDALNSMQ